MKKVILLIVLINGIFYSQYLGLNRNLESYTLYSGIFNSLNYKTPTKVYSKVVTLIDAKWLRLKFNSTKLGKNSFIIIEAIEDSSIQKLDAVTMEEWNNTSAYFNGNSVKISLFVGPGDDGIFFNINEIYVGRFNQNYTSYSITGIEDLCGSDDRVYSDNKAVGRIITEPSGTFGTGFILFNGRIATAGHVLSLINETGYLSIIEFNVPLSNFDGSMKHAAAIDQYTFKRSFIIEKHSNGEGDDYAIFFTNTNSGLGPKDRQNAFFYIEQNNEFETARVTGFGQDDGVANHTQQTATGSNQSSINNIVKYSVDTKDDNSGSPVINEANGKVVGIHTNGHCSSGYNSGTSFFNASLWSICNPEIDLTVHQKRENGTELTDTSYIGRWMGTFSAGSFQNYTVGLQGALIENVIYGNNEIFKAKQELTWVNSIEKYNNWANYNDVINQKSFLIEYGISELVAQHKKTYNGVTIKNDFPEVSGINPTGDVIEFKDPWLIDYEDPLLNGTNYRNRGMEYSLFKSRNSPFYPNLLNFYDSDQYLGVFINQDPAQGLPYYTVRSPIQQPNDIYLSQTQRYHKFYFNNWSSSGTDPLMQNNLVGNYYESPVVFRSGSATVMANLKGTQLSNQSNAYANTSQRKFIQTPDGVKHICYESMNRVWYEYSTNGGSSWNIGNGGKPLSTEDSKNPSMSFYGNQLGIVWQEKEGNGFKIKMVLFYGSNYSSSVFSTVADTDLSLDYSYNANPVIAWGYNGKVVVIWSGTDLCTFNSGVKLKYAYGSATSNAITWYTQCGIEGTDENSVNPTIAAVYSVNSSPFYFHIAWQQNINSSTSKINYSMLSEGSDQYLQYTIFEEASSNSGYSKNYQPVILIRKVGDYYLPYITWMGYRTTPSTANNVIMRYKQYGSWSSVSVYGSNTVQSFSVNNAGLLGWQEVLGLSWSEPIYPGSATYFNKAVKVGSSSNINTLSTNGKHLQINNSSSYSNMNVNSFQSSSSPYSFALSQPFSSLSKENSLSIFNGRGGVVGKDGAQFFFTLGDILVNGKKVEFVDIPDSINLNNLQMINKYLESNPVTVNGNSSLTYGVEYGIVDSVLCSAALSNSGNIKFKVEMIDDKTGEILDVFDEVTYSQSNVFQYDNLGYQVNLNGMGERTIKLRLAINTNSDFDFSLFNRISDQSMLAKTSYQKITYQGPMAVTSYSLNQNYPNPFNPNTQISYQLPKASFVTLKIFDMLGKEIATLVNEQQNEGRYEVKFEASSLASGVYIYKLQAGDFVSSKKMILMK